ncbi:hypothetical protein CLAFUW4_04707 [Fulvia fulva]|uniref:MYND-type domain-containing protein n=1 Tax=Passalora fulva TaxID=5499 RepID=A0A9Q8LFC7_PASFU|nr:uncharacterized protein CLAFUR5_04667 [Fulvia fulva]KAK4626352.1 hypothetical protein CLAFUR4_04693 [Fulvia fulva]KAK4628051.1 hypothetical protein CLAFUR0_04697 [Fulvia fulva]UJO16383.1 hypothetical protein CLAFUR5_04667 [Fulvia fulva]WPV14411.1 hypothetical protein CLAFUW4_04707 [Fulvia fulva]WPV28843.1 hypothetical protein CLAFUW7_04701 [Fulvia fulva]
MSANGESSASATSSSEPSTMPALPSCGNCGKLETSTDADEQEAKLLKPCIMCKSVSYCSRDCKKADTKKHKKVCAKAAQEYAQIHEIKMASRAPPKADAHQKGLQKWQFDT